MGGFQAQLRCVTRNQPGWPPYLFQDLVIIHFPDHSTKTLSDRDQAQVHLGPRVRTQAKRLTGSRFFWADPTKNFKGPNREDRP